MRTLLLARHGQSVSNAVRRFQGALSNGSLSRVAPPRVLSVNETAHLAGVDGTAGGAGFHP